MACYNSGDFSKYFTENMESLGLGVPSSLFESYDKAMATASALVSALQTLGRSATLAELAGATNCAELLVLGASMGAAYYVGAVIGSIAVASGKSLGCGTSMADMVAFVHATPGLAFVGWKDFYIQHPEVFDTGQANRRLYFSKSLFGAGYV
ncbi:MULTISPECIES: hypothetical protein [unclassified Pseudomonas]|uniref:hypothetical protein n=1 Tax=unclassified Pseudomonas TaxID=196821 RepID=UPI0011B76C90|nr:MULTISPECIES: hypothetical protein [unclassified Pseudomonas]